MARQNMTQKSQRERANTATSSAAAKQRMDPHNKKALIWLWFFPMGLPLMWDKRCTWHRAVKIGVTAVIVAALFFGERAMVRFFDSSKIIHNGGIVGQTNDVKPEAEVYGPPLPTVYVRGYTNESTGSILTDEAQEDELHYVYASKDQKRYHEYECKFAYASSQRMTVYEAYYKGYTPCGLCNPPAYTPGDELAVREKTATAEP